MTVSKIRLNGTDHDIRAKYLIQSTSADATSAEFSERTTTEDAIANIKKIYGNTVVVSNNLVSNSATAIQSKDAGDNVIGGCDLNIPTLTGKLNGTGSSVVIFPYGMGYNGANRDELINGKAIRKLGFLDLGTLTYSYTSSTTTFAAAHGLSSIAKHGAVAICANYTQVSSIGSSTPDKVFAFMSSWSGYNYIHIKDTSYTNAAAFKTAMSGVLIIYDLATQQEYILDNALKLQYPVVAGGTEMVLPTTGTAPMKMDVIYGNAADAAATMSQNYISVDSMKEFLDKLGAQMGGTWSMGYENGKHTFTFTT